VLAVKLNRSEAWVPRYLALQSSLSGLSFSMQRNTVQMLVKGNAALALTRPSLAAQTAQIPELLDLALLREDRSSEILVQTTETLAFWRSILPFESVGHAHTQSLLAIALELCVVIHMRFKHHFACLRPDQLSPQVQPMIPTPRHGSYPAGHFAEAALTARLLSQLSRFKAPRARSRTQPSAAWEQLNVQLWRQALRIGDNRVVAGVHFPLDNLAGGAVGLWCADYVMALAGAAAGTGTIGSRLAFDPADFSTAAQRSLLDSESSLAQALAPKRPGRPIAIETDPLFAYLWSQARAELQGIDPEGDARE
jgi:membrane-associated phospholipid phosphatase